MEGTFNAIDEQYQSGSLTMDFLSSMLWPEESSFEDNNNGQNPALDDSPLSLEDEKKETKKKLKQSQDIHPYPASISIQMNDDYTEVSDRETRCSRATSSRERGRSRSRSKVSSNYVPTTQHSPDTDSRSELSDLHKFHESGRKQFLCNRLAEAVDFYTRAIRVGQEMVHRRKEATPNLEASLAQVHFDLAFALEIAGKYAESANEMRSGRDLLKQSCYKKKDDRLKECMKNIQCMERAVDAEMERGKYRSKMESAMSTLVKCSCDGEKDSVRKNAIGVIKQLIRIERESLGEQSYAVSKLRLKIAKLRYEGNDLEGSLNDADVAIKTLRNNLGPKHTLVGAACLFAASINEKLASVLSSTKVTDPKPITNGMIPECKSAIRRARHLYNEALDPLKFKHSISGDKSKVQSELGDVYQRIGRLYGKEGSYTSAIDAYHSSLEAYGATGVGENEDLCPDAVAVWHSVGELHLIMNKFDDAAHAAKNCTKLAKMVPKSSSNENIAISGFQIAGDAYMAMNKFGNATRAYQEALNAFRNARLKSDTKNSFTPLEEAKILKKIGNSLLNEDKSLEAKTVLLDALERLRSDRSNEKSLELPMLMSNIGHAHIRCGEYMDAMKILRACLKHYSDQGISTRSPEVARAKHLYKEAQHGPQHQFEPLEDTYAVSLSPERSPQRTITTQSTVPSSVYSSNLSSGVYSGATLNSIQGQLQKLLDQLQASEASKTSPQSSHRPPKVVANEIPLGEVESIVKRLQEKIRPNEYRFDRTPDSVSNTQLKVQKEVEVSESSYQQMTNVVEEMKVTHEIEKKRLEREITRLRKQQQETAADSSSEEVSLLKEQIHRLKELNKKSSDEVSLLKSANSTLQTGNDAAMSEIDSLNKEIGRLKHEANRTLNDSDEKRKKIEYELKQERSRRVILEASIEKEYDNRGGGGFAYHPMMPFGYPMQVGTDKNFKALEIDLATERANKEMLEDMIKEMTETHKQEVNELSTQLDGLPDVVSKLEAYEIQNTSLGKELNEAKIEAESVKAQFDSALNDLACVQENFLQASGELSALMEENNALSDARNLDREALEFTKKELAKTRTALATAQSDLQAETETCRANILKINKLQQDYNCLKNEFKNAIARFQTEIEEGGRMKDEEIARMKIDQTTKDGELVDTRLHLENVLAELREAQDSRDILQTEFQSLEMVLEKTRLELEINTEELRKATTEADALGTSYEEVKSARSELEQTRAQQQTDYETKVVELESKLSLVESTKNELEGHRTDLQSRLSKSEEQVHSVLKVLKQVSTALDIAGVHEGSDDRDDVILQVIASDIESAVESKNKEVKAAAWNLTHTANELDILEKKHQELKDELTEIGDLRTDHDDLLQEFKQLSQELLEVNVEKEEAQDRCDLHKSRLKDAVDDLEELEYERDELKVELDQTIEDSARLEASLRDMIGALEDENERLKKYESATVDFDAVVWEKDQKLKLLKEELNATHSQLTILRGSATSKTEGSGGEIYPDILPDTQDVIEEISSLRSTIHSLEKRNLELSEKLAKSEGLVDLETIEEETAYDGSELETLKLRFSELSEQKDKLEVELSKMRTHADELEMQRESGEFQERIAALDGHVSELERQLQESQKEVVSAANIHDSDVDVIASLHDSLEVKEKQYNEEVAKLEEQVAELQDTNSSLEDRLASTYSANDSNLKDSSEETRHLDILDVKAQIRRLEQENNKLSVLLTECQAESIDASRTHADDQETICELKNELVEKDALLQSTQQEMSNRKDDSCQEELQQWITRVDVLENELSELKNREPNCSECEQRNQQLANVIESLNDLQIENQGLKTEILLWETADDDGKDLGKKVNFEKEMNAAHNRFVSMEKSLQDSIERLEKEKETLVAAHDTELSSQIRQHDKTRIELSAWKLEMQNALNDIESLKRENDDLRNSFNAVSQTTVTGENAE